MEGLYKHYKGSIYKVLYVAKHTETLEDLIVYHEINDEQKVWVRPQKMFEEMVEIEGSTVKRFKKL